MDRTNTIQLRAVMILACWGGLSVGLAQAADEFTHVPADFFEAAEGLEVTLWAKSPLVNNPTNMDWDAQGRCWVTQSMDYRRNKNPVDSVVVISDTDGDGVADSSHPFVTDPDLVAPLGITVIDNVILVASSPNMVKYTDVNRNAVFDPDIDTKEFILTGHGRPNHDHSLHSIVVGPDGRWYYNVGNAGPTQWTSPDGFELILTSSYDKKLNGLELGAPSSDGRTYVGGAMISMQPDCTDIEVHGHNFRNAYEHVVDSFGDYWQNDNDDPPACRTTWLMDGSNMGFSSADGRRGWKFDQRPGQSTPIAHWRQEDPGTTPPGHVYGRGSPTGIVMYENGALGDKYIGTLLSAEALWSEIFGYQPEPTGAGFQLDKFPFMNSYAKKGGPEGVSHKWFRPADVSVGPDGLVYVADWFDPGVGGHRTRDDGKTGAIYRVAPPNAVPQIPPLDLDSIGGAIQVLQNPAVNIRALGASALVTAGERSIPSLKKLLVHDNHFIRARAIWVLARIGGSAVALVEQQLNDANPRIRIAAYRALHRLHGGDKDLKLARRFATDADPAMRREIALDLRGRPFAETKDLLVSLAQGYDGVDRWYLEALGKVCEGHEVEAYNLLAKKLGTSDPLAWDARFAGLAWRLHPAHTVEDFLARAMSDRIDLALRHQAIVAIGFIDSQAAADAMYAIATADTDESLIEQARWWIYNGSENLWKEYSVDLAVIPVEAPSSTGVASAAPNGAAGTGLQGKALSKRIAAIKKEKGHWRNGAFIFFGKGACSACHSQGGRGGTIGPELTGISEAFGDEAFYEALLAPSAGIALGFEQYEVVARVDGKKVTIIGKVEQDGADLKVTDTSGHVHVLTKDQVISNEQSSHSIMPSADTLGLTNKDLANLFEYLRLQEWRDF